MSAGATVLLDAPNELPADGSPQNVLAITWRPTGPFINKVCFNCVLSFVDGLQGSGAPVKVRAVRDNVSVIPAAPDAFIDSCIFVTPRPLLPGDCNSNEDIDITDPLFLLNFLFGDGSAPPRAETCDADGNGMPEISDAIWLLNYLFSGGPPPVPPL